MSGWVGGRKEAQEDSHVYVHESMGKRKTMQERDGVVEVVVVVASKKLRVHVLH